MVFWKERRKKEREGEREREGRKKIHGQKLNDEIRLEGSLWSLNADPKHFKYILKIVIINFY
jgi:hypothetical protein